MPHPDGVLAEAFARTEDGIMLVRIWESEKAREAWAESPEHRAALKASGILEASESHNTSSPSSKTASVPEIRGDPSARNVAIVLCLCASNSARTLRANSGSVRSTSNHLATHASSQCCQVLVSRTSEFSRWESRD